MSISFAAAGLAAIMALAPAADVKPCRDPIVQVLKAAGFKGESVRTGYGITWRESNHNPQAVGNGSYGLFQLQESAWGGTRYWPASPLDALSNAKAAHRIWQQYSWRPWGISANGDGVDRRDYMEWSEDQIVAWVWQPYTVGLAKFDRLPRGCRS